ncbi:MAG: hypothetical protein A3F68_01320 [Acidobacteria bacterium RIFCSPLOWO2_12_FULL_54_10]|nr:MAG: hypothetical protein A3F68_01320 [Acidobacteria bacterium RIFCSPLOWO2_12_FULL_54_10]
MWSQLKNLTADELISALLKDGWRPDEASKSAIRGYIKSGSPNVRVTIHYHPKKTFGPNLLKALLADIGWAINDLKRLKLIK